MSRNVKKFGTIFFVTKYIFCILGSTAPSAPPPVYAYDAARMHKAIITSAKEVL